MPPVYRWYCLFPSVLSGRNCYRLFPGGLNINKGRVAIEHIGRPGDSGFAEMIDTVFSCLFQCPAYGGPADKLSVKIQGKTITGLILDFAEGAHIMTASSQQKSICQSENLLTIISIDLPGAGLA